MKITTIIHIKQVSKNQKTCLSVFHFRMKLMLHLYLLLICTIRFLSLTYLFDLEFLATSETMELMDKEKIELIESLIMKLRF
jgi:hypothetical protein